MYVAMYAYVHGWSKVAMACVHVQEMRVKLLCKILTIAVHVTCGYINVAMYSYAYM